MKAFRRSLSPVALKTVASTALALVLALLPTALSAQKPAAEAEPPKISKTFYLSSVSEQMEANEILVALRNLIDPRVKIYLVSSRKAILMEASASQIEQAQKIIDDLSRARKMYRLTYTVRTMEGDKRVGAEHFTIVAVAGERTTLRRGNRVPVSTGIVGHDSSTPPPQINYLDVGMNFEVTLSEMGDGVSLHSKVERSSLSGEKLAGDDPVVRQSTVENTFFLAPGKPFQLASLDVADSTQRLEIEVVAEPMP